MKTPRNTDIADAIKARVARYYKRKRRVCYFELGLCRRGRLRADVFVLAMTGHIVVVEVKSSVRDFRTDKKMTEYEQFCNQSYIAMPEPVYNKVKDDIPQGWGVFIMGDNGTTIRKVKKARNFDLDPEQSRELYIRAAFRNSDTTNRKNRQA